MAINFRKIFYRFIHLLGRNVKLRARFLSSKSGEESRKRISVRQKFEGSKPTDRNRPARSHNKPRNKVYYKSILLFAGGRASKFYAFSRLLLGNARYSRHFFLSRSFE